MRKIRVAGCVRDIGAGNVVSPILLEIRRRGHETTLFVEHGGKADGRVEHPLVRVHSAQEVERALHATKPNIVIVGLSSPDRYLEEVFERKASAWGIPVVHAEDYIKAFDKSPMCADLILSPDMLAASLAQKACPLSKVKVVGCAGIYPLTPSAEATKVFERLREHTGAKILYCGDADPADAESTVGLLVKSILCTKSPVRLIYSPHPKFAGVVRADGRVQGEVMQQCIAPLRERGLIMEAPVGVSADEAAMLSDATCSGYSTLLCRAADSGKTALTLHTPKAAQTFKLATTGRTAGLDKTWLTLMGLHFPVIMESQPLDEILSAPRPFLSMVPLNTALAADAIESCVH